MKNTNTFRFLNSINIITMIYINYIEQKLATDVSIKGIVLFRLGIDEHPTNNVNNKNIKNKIFIDSTSFLFLLNYNLLK